MLDVLDPEVLAWDSDFWGVRVGRAVHPDAVYWESEFDCLFLLIDANETAVVHRAEARGYRLMDVQVTLRSTHGHAVSGGRDVEPADLAPLARLARRSHRLTRFYADPRFPDTRCDDLYEEWIRNSVGGWANTVRVIGPVGAPQGYVTVHADREDSSLGLIAVDDQARRQGFGLRLVRAALWEAFSLGASSMRVVTQGRNIAAQRMFQRAGFVTERTELWFHKWTTE